MSLLFKLPQIASFIYSLIIAPKVLIALNNQVQDARCGTGFAKERG